MNTTHNNKRVAKNTVLLYIRMLVTTIISLFTARLTLQLLGVQDYGINNVVGGIVGFVGIVTGSMVSASQRFLAFHLGNNDIKKFSESFRMLVNICALFCIFAIFILELVGPKLIHSVLVIPFERINAALWVFQFSIINFCLSTMLIPYTSAIVSYEKMGIYAYFTFIDVIIKLLIVYALYITPIDKLITISALTVLSNIVINIVNFIYCKKTIIGCSYKWYWDNGQFRHITSFIGWNLFGSLTVVLNNQGQAILLNIFFGPVINAAKAIADKINQVMYSFCQNFFMAINPQIIKCYASGDIEYTKKIVLNSSKFSIFLFTLIAMPLIYNMRTLLYLWLGKDQVSEIMVSFCQLILILSFTSCLESPITQIVRATGHIKKYQIVIGFQTLCFLPITYCVFIFGFPAYYSMIVLNFIYFIALFFRIKFLKDILLINTKDYIIAVVKPILPAIIYCIIILSMMHRFANDKSNLMTIVITMVDIIAVGLIICFIGLKNNERAQIIYFIKNRFLKYDSNK